MSDEHSASEIPKTAQGGNKEIETRLHAASKLELMTLGGKGDALMFYEAERRVAR